MTRFRKTGLIIFALALLAGLVWFFWLKSRPEELVEESVANTPGGPSFEVRVVVPWQGRPLGGILPDWIVRRLDGTPGELRFDQASPGAQIGVVEHDRLELRADGWDLFIETDGEGRVTPETRLVSSLPLGGRQVRLKCRPADRPTGYLRTTAQAGSDKFNGRFLVELASCENAGSGKTSDWPPRPLTVSGSFVGLPPGRR